MAGPVKPLPKKVKRSGVPKGYHKSKSGAIKANVGGKKSRFLDEHRVPPPIPSGGPRRPKKK